MADEKKNAMEYLLDQGDSSIYETNNVLARLWRIILNREEKVDINKWNRLITIYQEKQVKISSKKGAANLKGNLTRRLVNPKLSWNVFMSGLAVFNYDVVGLTLTLQKGSVTKEIKLLIPNDELIKNNPDDDEGE
jgi:hypothetical protein